jgi:hypothetical protein
LGEESIYSAVFTEYNFSVAIVGFIAEFRLSHPFIFRGIPAPLKGCYHLGCCLPAQVNGDGTSNFIMFGSADDVLDSAILQPFKITIFAAHE